MSLASLGERFQLVIPLKERKKLNWKPHTKLWVEAKGDHVLVRPLEAKKLRGLGKTLAGKEDAIDYVKKLRQEWERL